MYIAYKTPPIHAPKIVHMVAINTVKHPPLSMTAKGGQKIHMSVRVNDIRRGIPLLIVHILFW